MFNQTTINTFIVHLLSYTTQNGGKRVFNREAYHFRHGNHALYWETESCLKGKTPICYFFSDTGQSLMITRIHQMPTDGYAATKCACEEQDLKYMKYARSVAARAVHSEVYRQKLFFIKQSDGESVTTFVSRLNPLWLHEPNWLMGHNIFTRQPFAQKQGSRWVGSFANVGSTGYWRSTTEREPHAHKLSTNMTTR